MSLEEYGRQQRCQIILGSELQGGEGMMPSELRESSTGKENRILGDN